MTRTCSVHTHHMTWCNEIKKKIGLLAFIPKVLFPLSIE